MAARNSVMEGANSPRNEAETGGLHKFPTLFCLLKCSPAQPLENTSLLHFQLLRGGSTHSFFVNHCLTVTVVTHTPCSLLLELAIQISILNLYVLGLLCNYRTIYILSLLAFPSCTLHPPLSLDILKSCFH